MLLLLLRANDNSVSITNNNNIFVSEMKSIKYVFGVSVCNSVNHQFLFLMEKLFLIDVSLALCVLLKT